MKNLPKINPAKAVKASLPYVFVGLLCTKLGEAYRLTTGGDVLDKLLAAFTKLGIAFQNPLPSFHPFDLLVGAAAAVLLRLVVWSKIKKREKVPARRRIRHGPVGQRKGYSAVHQLRFLPKYPVDRYGAVDSWEDCRSGKAECQPQRPGHRGQRQWKNPLPHQAQLASDERLLCLL